MEALLVEDDQPLAALVGRVLREEGHAIEVARTIEEAEGFLAKKTFDILVLDRMLPDGDGLELCQRLRDRGVAVPILVLTARGELQDRVTGLRSGADDYLTKPFEIEELLARMDALKRRATEGWFLHAGPISIDLRTQTVECEGERIELTTREYALLTRLARANGACVARQTLLADVWNLQFDPGSGVIDVHISRLRDKLGAHASVVETVRGQGFRLRVAR